MSFGRLERTSGPQPMSDINMTPLVDVMLVLVVIFIITAPLLASSVRLDLPRTDAAQAGQPPAFVTLAVDKSGQAFLNDRPVTAAQLALGLAQAAAQNPETEVHEQPVDGDRRSTAAGLAVAGRRGDAGDPHAGDRRAGAARPGAAGV